MMVDGSQISFNYCLDGRPKIKSSNIKYRVLEILLVNQYVVSIFLLFFGPFFFSFHNILNTIARCNPEWCSDMPGRRHAFVEWERWTISEFGTEALIQTMPNPDLVEPLGV